MDAATLGSPIVQSLQAVLSQNAYLFNATLQENLHLAQPHLDDREMLEILQKVGSGRLVQYFARRNEYLDGEQWQSVERRRTPASAACPQPPDEPAGSAG